MAATPAAAAAAAPLRLYTVEFLCAPPPAQHTPSNLHHAADTDTVTGEEALRLLRSPTFSARSLRVVFSKGCSPDLCRDVLDAVQDLNGGRTCESADSSCAFRAVYSCHAPCDVGEGESRTALAAGAGSGGGDTSSADGGASAGVSSRIGSDDTVGEGEGDHSTSATPNDWPPPPPPPRPPASTLAVQSLASQQAMLDGLFDCDDCADGEEVCRVALSDIRVMASKRSNKTPFNQRAELFMWQVRGGSGGVGGRGL
jgi:hypothetical protein